MSIALLLKCTAGTARTFIRLDDAKDDLCLCWAQNTTVLFFSYGLDLGGNGITLEVVGNEPVVMVVESLAVCCKHTKVKID